jgi:predicted small metal-binding protein
MERLAYHDVELDCDLAEWVSEEEVLDKAQQHVYEDHVITSKQTTLEMKENIGEKTCNART